MSELGYFSLTLAFFVAAYALVVDAVAARYREMQLIRSARNATSACWLCLTVAMTALLIAFARCDFRLDYVAGHTALSVPLPYRLSGVWAGGSGSLLLWLWMQTTVVVVVLRSKSDEDAHWVAGARAMANLVAVFFLVVMLLDKNPFATSSLPPHDGRGMNPLLQHPGMILHPPALFAGYAAYIIPFAWAVAALVWHRGQPLGGLFQKARYWMLVAWFFLTLGNLLGAWWAYEELGWGGFWAWDPVENSSLMPWLTGTALLHSFKKFRAGSTAAIWVIVLALITYSLCIFGTFLTRYGLVSSVHAFPDPGWGIMFLVLLGVLWIVAGIFLVRFIVCRHRELVGSAGKSGVLLLTNCVFVILFIVILIGTLFPFLSGLVSENQITLRPEYFTKITAPGGLLILLLVGVCPWFFKRGGHLATIRGMGGVMAVFLAGSLTVVIWFRTRTVLLSPACLVLCIYAGLAIFAEILPRWRTGNDEQETSHRRRGLGWYGARLVHLGVVLIFMAIAGAEGWGRERLAALAPGESVQAGSYVLTFNEMTTSEGANFELVTANISVSRNGKMLPVFQPGLARYDTGQTTSEVDIRRTLGGDLYVALTAVEEAGELINIRVLVKPLINWLWIGGILMEIGVIVVVASWLHRKRSQNTP